MSKGIDGSPGQGKNVGGAGTCPAMLNRQEGGEKVFREKKKSLLVAKNVVSARK